jgi:hypothetical protein
MTHIDKRQQKAKATKTKKRPRAKSSRIPVPGQRFGSILQACNYGGVGRSKLYELGGRHKGLIKKIDGKSVVDFPMFDAILDALPNAEIGGVTR